MAFALIVAARHAVYLVHSLQRLHAARTGAAPQGSIPRDVPTWMPLRAISRRYHVPEATLEDALRSAGFTVEPQPGVPDIPDSVRGHIPFLDRAVRHGQEPHLLPPEGQSLRQIARASGKETAVAVLTVQEAVRRYDADHPGRPPYGIDQPRAPAGREQ